ncbi:hypothetical protein ACQKH5_09000 [Hyphomonas sp. NPDC076900]|uniref:hypothetical protein n=1 Tax=unclassified Hyphomonas TaxID=2630699 RepID=UPI003D002C45
MIKGRVLLAQPCRAQPPRGAWKLLRGLLLMLTGALWSVQHLAPSRMRAGALRNLARHIGALEHGLRCLLLLMRAAPAPRVKLPEGLARCQPRRTGRRKSHRFSLSPGTLAKGFARHGREISGLAPKPCAPPPTSRPPRGPTASAPIADPADLLRARLAALRAVFADPHGHAAKLSAILSARGFRLRALKALIPAVALCVRMNHPARAEGIGLPATTPNTS